MADITLFDFDGLDVRLTMQNGEPWWVASDVCYILGLSNVSSAVSVLDTDEKSKLNLDLPGKPWLINEFGLYSLILNSRKPAAKGFKRWITHEVIPTIRKTGEYSVNKQRENLEKSILPKATLKDIDYVSRMMGRAYGKPYQQSYINHQLKRHHPHLLGPAPTTEDRASLKSAKALLTPTEIAQQLGLKYKSGNPNPRKVNQMLEELGYQENIQGKWSATELGQKYCDRKPVDTDSRSDKDQLFWYLTVIPILQEHVTPA